MNGALSGVRVLSMAELYPGPYCTMLLADMGAEVILVERPGIGDRARGGWLGKSLGRNKKSITLNLKCEAAHQVCYRLARTADVFVEGFRPGIVAELGVDYQRIKAENPRIVYCSISGYGQEGPYRRKAGHDLSYQALSGILADLIPGASFDQRPSVAIADLSSGMFAAIGILAALVHRGRTGLGQYVDVSMTDGLVSWMTAALTAHLNAGNSGEGSGAAGRPGYGVFRCKDGFFTLSIAGEEHFWRNLCVAFGRPAYAEMPRNERSNRLQETNTFFAGEFAKRTRAELDALLMEADVPAGPVLSLDEVLADPQIASRELVASITDHQGNTVKHVKSPVRFSETPVEIRSAAPALGADTFDILHELGYAEEEIEELKTAGAI